MKRKVKQNRDGSVTVTVNGKDNAKFWTDAEREKEQWLNDGYTLTHIESGESSFHDSILTTFLNIFRTLFNMAEKHDPVIKMTFIK